jgi:hypothetical protein
MGRGEKVPKKSVGFTFGRIPTNPRGGGPNFDFGGIINWVMTSSGRLEWWRHEDEYEHGTAEIIGHLPPGNTPPGEWTTLAFDDNGCLVIVGKEAPHRFFWRSPRLWPNLP